MAWVARIASNDGAVAGAPDLDAAARGAGMCPVFQPIVDLTDGTHTGFEALARWPGTGFSPSEVFAHAVETGRSVQLDQLCITTAIAIGLTAGLPAGIMLAVNSEPASDYIGRDREPILTHGGAHFSIIFELTERCLLEHPRSLLAKVNAIRSDGFWIALDDVGANVDSLTLLDVIEPDVVKLDLGLVQTLPTCEQSRTLAAVLAYQERTNAVIVAEGIENDGHLKQAMALGATLGQGYLFGHPQSLNLSQSFRSKQWSHPIPQRSTSTVLKSPFDVVTTKAPARTASKEILVALSRQVERQISDTADPPMVLTTLQHGRHFTAAVQRRYQRLAETAPLVAVFGRDMGADLYPGLRGVDISATDPLANEWTVLALGAHTAVALIAREHFNRPSSRDVDRQFSFVLTYDRALVIAAARTLLSRIP